MGGLGGEGGAAEQEAEFCEYSLCSDHYLLKGRSGISVCKSSVVFHTQNGLSAAKTEPLPVGLVPLAAVSVGMFHSQVVSDNRSKL